MACSRDRELAAAIEEEEAEESEGIWMNVDKKYDDELLTKVLREPFEYNTPTVSPPPDDSEPRESHYHPQFNEKDYLKRRHSHVHLHTPLKPLGTTSDHSHHQAKKDKVKKGHKKKKKDESSRSRSSPDKTKTTPAEEKTKTISTATETVETPEIKLETNVDIVDQTISVLPEIDEHEILSTPPLHSFLTEQAEATPVTDSAKEAKVGRHRHKHADADRREGASSKMTRHHKHHHHHRHRRKTELEERRRPGVATLNEKEPVTLETPEEEAAQEDAAAMNLKDAEDMTFHRFEDLKGVRRRPLRVHRSGMTTHFSNQDLSASLKSLVSHLRPQPKKKIYDHRPHENFVELEELTTVGDETEWKEKARWIKFEEDVEDSLRWGKPHIPSLSFHSLLELRRGLETGAVLLDLEQFDLSSIAEAVIDEMVITDQLPSSQRSKVLTALLAKHRHQHQMTRGLPRRGSSTNLASLFGVESKSAPMKVTETDFSPAESSSACEAAESIPLEPARPRTTSDASSQTPFSTLDYLAKGSRLPPEAALQLGGHFTNSRTEPDVKVIAQTERVVKKDVNNETEKRVGVSFTPEPVVEGVDLDNTTSDIRGRIPFDAEATAVLVGTMDELQKPAMAFVRLAKGCHLGNLTEVPLPVRFIFVLLGPQRQDDQYREIGRSIATLMSDQIFHNLAYQAEQKQDILSAINQFLSDSIVLAPGDWDERVLLPILEGHSREVMRKRRRAATQRPPDEESDPLKRLGRPFGGLVKDVRRKYPHYRSDFVDAFKSFQCLVAFIFVYFAAIAPCITYGGLLSKKTDGWIGLSESIFATSLGGILFGLFSGQPLMIVGVTGPVLLFEQTVYNFSKTFGIDYLVWRVWIGLWIVVICTLVIAFEGCFLVKYFTRFTEEIFACLISFIFIYEAGKFIFETFKEHPLRRSYSWEERPINISLNPNASEPNKKHVGPENKPNTALLTIILLFGTVLLTVRLRKFRHSHFIGRMGRRTVSDFGMAISIITMSVLDYSIKDVYTQKIPELSKLQPTLPDKRGWLVDPAGVHAGWIFAAAIPGLFVSILLFMETELTGIVLNKKENNLRKGAGYNLDLLVVGLVCGLCSFMGLPWICAGPVRSVSHKNALTVMSTSHAPGERAHVVKVIEQRVTNVVIHIFIGFSVLLAPALKVIPIAVLFGVFVYLGMTSLSGNQFVIRFFMFFMPSKYYPDFIFVRKVSSAKIHLYTLIQLMPLFVLVAVKMTIIAPLFPLLIICLIPLRNQLHRLYNDKELAALDNEESLVFEEEMDEYNMIHVPV